MIKWFAYIVFLLILAPCLSSAKIKNKHFSFVSDKLGISLSLGAMPVDTSLKKNDKKDQEDKKKIKEVAKAKRQPKPEKIEPVDNQATQPKQRPKRQRRPEGLERPPEIPRRNGN
ncbi:hypothetical protein [Mucilaginibacter sp.]|uniref:hypothetical protein n=1 Tax=Mucilaginibacter sp. TaxID=1882438 RepID=UPI003D1072DE